MELNHLDRQIFEPPLVTGEVYVKTEFLLFRYIVKELLRSHRSVYITHFVFVVNIFFIRRDDF